MSLSNKGCFKIDGVEFTPKSLTPSYSSLASSDSGRSDDGTMHLSWVLRKIRKLSIEMPPCSASEASAILSKVQGQIYNITYFDALENAEKTIQCYTSESKADCYSGVLHNGLYQGVSFNAIETGGSNT